MTEITYGADPRYAESKAAVKALIAVLYKRWPSDVAAIESWTDGYFDNLVGWHPRPILSAQEIKAVGRATLNRWKIARFPRPGDFLEARDDHAVGKSNEAGSEQWVAIADARNAGIKAALWEGDMILGRYWTPLYNDLLRDLGCDADRVRAQVANYLTMYPRIRWMDMKPAQVRGFEALPDVAMDEWQSE